MQRSAGEDRGDATRISGLHAQGHPTERDLGPGERDPPEAVHDQAADRVVRRLVLLLVVGQLEQVA